MRPIKGAAYAATQKRRIVTLFLLLAPLAAHAESAESVPQIETRDTPAASSLWQAFVDTLRGQPTSRGDLNVTVTDTDGRALSGVTVMAGESKGVPFPNNMAVTDASGSVSFSDESLRGGQPISVTASLRGYTTISLLGNKENTLKIALPRHPDERGFGFLRGKLNGIPKFDSGTLEIGFFAPALRTESLLNFDPQNFVSSYTVKVNIYGDRDIPGNIVLPNQSKRYGFIPINLSKPDFIMPLPTGLNAHMAGIAAGVPISKAADLAQSKDYLEIVNVVSITNVGWTRDRVEVRGNDNFDVNANQTVTPNKVTAQISGLSRAPLDVVAVSLLDPSGDKGDYVAMDLKAIKSEKLQNGGGSMRLGQISSARANDNFYVFAALFDKNQIQDANTHWIVGSFLPVKRQSTVKFDRFLNPIRPLGVGQDNREYRFTNPAGSRVAPSFVLLNVVSEKNNPETKGKTRTVLWSALVQGSTDKIVLPDLGRAVLPQPDSSKGEKFHWEVTGIRTGSSRSRGLNLRAALRDLQDVSTLVQNF